MGMDRDSRTDHWQPDRLWQSDGGADSTGRKEGRRGYDHHLA